MAQERGIARPAAILLLTLALQSCGLWHSASAATYTVGGSKGWDIGIDYTGWAAGKTFKVGDILYFPYLEEQHDVVVVDKADYDACSGANPIATFSDGNTNVTLSTTGKHYYLCSVIGHCGAGMKLSVTVAAAAAAAPPASPPATAPLPSSSPLTAPTSAPSPAPSSPSPAPAPGPAPVSAPSPSPLTPVPAAGTPASSPSAPGSTPSSAGSPPSPASSPNAAPSLLALASGAILPLIALCAAFLVSH